MSFSAETPHLPAFSIPTKYSSIMVSPEPPSKPGFHRRRALLESFVFLSIEQAYVVKDDFSWVTIENGVPLNHYWRDYKQSLSTFDTFRLA